MGRCLRVSSGRPCRPTIRWCGSGCPSRRRPGWSASRGRCVDVLLRFTPGPRRAGRRRARGGSNPIAFQKAIVWSMLFEVLGLGCGSGPLTGPLLPPIGGFLYFLRPGTTKLPLFPGVPLIGGDRRTVVDVLLYAALLVALVRARSWLRRRASTSTSRRSSCSCPCSACSTRRSSSPRGPSTTGSRSSAARVRAGNWIAGAKAVQLALWFWAGVSKLNHHFPAVVCVMTSNSPFTALRVAAKADVPRVPRRPAPVAPRDGGWRTHGHRARARGAAGAPARAGGTPPDRRPRADARAARLHHQQRADGRADRVELHDGLRRLRAVLGAPRGQRARARDHTDDRLLADHAGRPALARQPVPARDLVLALDALLRRKLGLRRVALSRRVAPQARAADEERGRGSTTSSRLLRSPDRARRWSAR